MKKLWLLFFVVIFILATGANYAQATGDYGSGVTPGTWTTAAHWLVCVTPGTWSDATVAVAAPTSTINVFIRSGYTMNYPTSAQSCKNLTIDNGGVLTQGATGNKLTPRYLRIYGTTVTVNGTFGEATGCLGIQFYSAGPITLTGTPAAFYATRLAPTVANTSVIFDANVTATYGGSAWPLAGSASIYCNGFATTFTINAGKTVTMDTSAYLSVGSSGSADPSSGANITVNVYGTLTQVPSGYSNINLRNTAAFTSTLYVAGTGTVNCGNSLYAPTATLAGGVTVTVDAGGSVNFVNTGGICDISKATTIMNGTWDFNNVSKTTRSLGATASVGGKIRTRDTVLSTVGTLSLNTGSTVEYYGTTAITGITASPLYNLQINNAGGVSLGANVVVNNALTLTSGKLTLGVDTLTVAGAISGAGAASYVVTNSTGGLLQNVSATGVSFPVGFTDTYTPVVLTNAGTADNFLVSVNNVIDHAALNNQVVTKQWTIAEAVAGGSNVTAKFQWNTADENALFVRTNPVFIGKYNSVSSLYDSTSAVYADLTGGVYTATAAGFTTFSTFVVGNRAAFIPTLAGDYYIPQGSHPLGFATLAAACSTLTAIGVSAPVRLLIDGNLTETAANLIITAPSVNATNTVTILPNTSTIDTITMTGCAASGNSSKAGFTIYGTNYVTVDGLNGVGSGLTFALSDATNGSYCFNIVGSSNFAIQNCSLIFPAIPATSTGIETQYLSTTNSNSITIQNVAIGKSATAPTYGIYTKGLASPNYNTNMIIKNNTIYAVRVGIDCNYFGAASNVNEISGNTLYLGSPTFSTNYVEGIFFADYGGTINVFNNKILSLTSNLSGTSYGMLGIATLYGALTGTVLNIYNNFITGFTCNSTYAGPLYGIWFEDGTGLISPTVNLYFNTIYMNSTGGKATGTVVAIGRLVSTNSTLNITMKNNILYNDNGTATSWIAYFPATTPGSAGTLTSNFNDLYVSGLGNMGYFNAAATLDLAAWKTASSTDGNSISKPVIFTSLTAPIDLHLTGTSNGDPDLRGTPISGITTDIDGQTRNITYPYMGADEAPIILPVELTSFEANVSGGKVIISWKTATEINNKGFEVQRKGINDISWSPLGFISGNGTTVSANQYSYTDRNINSGKFNYRLKQIDQNGSVTYSTVLNIVVNVPGSFNLSQNYPNPFNPSTKIDYQLPVDASVKIEMYNIVGQKVSDLVNQEQSAGFYSINVNSNTFKGMASGVYIYKMTAIEKVSGKNFVNTKKLMLMK